MTPHGLTSFPVAAGLAAIAFSLSPFVWMHHWFSSAHFIKASGQLLPLKRNAAGLLITAFYVLVMGRGIGF